MKLLSADQLRDVIVNMRMNKIGDPLSPVQKPLWTVSEWKCLVGMLT